MPNLKIKLNSESEAEEVKRLAVKAGYKLDALFGRKWSNEFCYLVLCENMSAGFANEIMADGDKQLLIGELRAMANPVKEYLVPQNAGGFMYKKAYESKCIPDSWIEIPEGMNFAYKDDMYTHFTKMEMGYRDAEIIWQREQDEPFLTPECTLNDQYAEIEQVRQVEIHGTAKAKPDLNFGAAQSSGGVDATLAERQAQYGSFEDVAFVTENIMSILAKVRVNGLDDLPNTHRMALYMIASKMARIVNGDFNHLDSWHDIGGYAKLIEKLIKGE